MVGVDTPSAGRDRIRECMRQTAPLCNDLGSQLIQVMKQSSNIPSMIRRHFIDDISRRPQVGAKGRHFVVERFGALDGSLRRVQVLFEPGLFFLDTMHLSS